MSYSPALAGAELATPVCYQGCLDQARAAQLQVVGLSEGWGRESGAPFALLSVCGRDIFLQPYPLLFSSLQAEALTLLFKGISRKPWKYPILSNFPQSEARSLANSGDRCEVLFW